MLANTSFKNPVTPEPTVWLVVQAMPHVNMPRAASGYSKCNFVKLHTVCNLNICKRYILTEGFQPLISVGGCITASPPLFKPNHTELWCCYKEQHCEHRGFVQIVFRLQSNHSQIALRIKSGKKNPEVFLSGWTPGFTLGALSAKEKRILKGISQSISSRFLFNRLLTALGSAYTLSKEELGFGPGSPSMSSFTSGLQRNHHCIHFCVHFLKKHNILHIYVWLKELLNPGQNSE